MTITQLEYIVAVATHKSFVAAAEKCYVTQPTLSMQIHKLEEELSVRIFDRNQHPIGLTEIGEEIIAQAKVILTESFKIPELIQHHRGEISGSFRMAVIPTLAPYILPQLLENHAKHHPELQIIIEELQTPDIVKRLKDDDIDCALMSTPLDNNYLKEYPLFYEPLVVYLGENEPVFKKRTLAPEDIDLKSLWMLNEGNCLRNQVLNLCTDNVQKVQEDKMFRYESGNVETLRRMVDKNGGMTVIPELATVDFGDDQLDKLRYFEAPEPVREVSLVTNDHFVRLSVLKYLMETILELVPEKMRVQKKDRKVLRIQTAKL